MKEYEVVREIPNLCRNNQMRDVFFDEVETDDPVQYVRDFLKGKSVEISVDEKPGGAVTVYALCDGLQQKFVFTPISIWEHSGKEEPGVICCFSSKLWVEFHGFL